MSGELSEAALALRARLVERAGHDIEDLRQQHAGRRAREVGGFLALWALGASLALLGLHLANPWRVGLVVTGIAASAVALNAFMLLTHEGHHGLLARDSRRNRLATLALCLPLLHSPSAYRVLHTRHHRHLGEDGDPDDYHNYTNKPWAIWTLHWMRLTVGPVLYIFAIPSAAWRVATRPDRRRILVDYGVLAAVYAAVFLLVPTPVLLVAWLVPLLPVGYFTALRGLAQHGLTDRSDPYLATRTFRAHPLVALCLLNENYHLEHHLFPEVPSYHLRQLHERIWPHLPRATLGRSYLAFLGAFVRRSFRADESPLGVTRLEGA